MIVAKLQSDQITYLKAGEKQKLETVRYILAQIKNKEIEKRTPLTDEEVVQTLRKQVKELRESITAFEKGGRTDLTASTKVQLELVSSYLPTELTDGELKEAVEKIIASNRPLADTNPKALIGLCVGQLKSRAEPGRIVQMIQSLQKP
ncbi:GatB/YqeY domain-containing protein [Candidatus Roizmanbacteria bacterium]|nr:GatB/YqeY domain-containing protein [Candidatus Roizmanbacteria bacterium]